MRDQRRQWDARHLGGKCRRQDVADDHVGAHLFQQGQQRPRRLGRVSPLWRIGVRRGEHAVFLRRGEAQAGALDRGPSLLPGLDRHLVSAPGQGSAKGDCWKDVPRVAEGSDQEAARGCQAPRLAA